MSAAGRGEEAAVAGGAVAGGAARTGPEEMPLYEYVAGDSPLLISFPHSGTYLPRELESRLQAGVRDLPDTDWFVPELYGFHAEIGASILRATHSRYVIDLNRPADGAPLYPGQRETTVCPTETFAGEPLYAAGDEPGRAEVGLRLQRYWQPYHERITALAAALVARHGYCVLWDAHSILSRVPALFDGRLPHLNIGTADGGSCSAARRDRLGACLRAQSRFTHVLDGRFKGGYITRNYGNPAGGIDAVQLEIAQDAYLDEARKPVYSRERAAPLIEVLQDLVRTVI
jgi:N-formylglutamate deformylase